MPPVHEMFKNNDVVRPCYEILFTNMKYIMLNSNQIFTIPSKSLVPF
jgi:hypothetical protein